MIHKHLKNDSLHLHKCEQLALEINNIFPLSPNVIEAISKGSKGYVLKPVTKDKLEDVIGKLNL